MALDDDIRVLSGVGLFEGFTREQLRLIAFGAESMTLGAGRDIYAEGAPADCAFIIASGSVVLFSEQEERRQVVDKLGPGEILGELALITEGRRLTSAMTESETRLVRLSRSTFHRILEEFPETAVLLHRRISKNLQAMIARMEATASRLIR
ncbi:cyclic nucleotide-binding domain-containing protein [Nitratireductor indicus]|uniref:Cyclic nucleotide-binding protein n=1 Tax=Nitratireductor indicus C115 TaxID=1231190 RepID=K2NM87_9HYPH|nr:cyclic nucleotide-binding domain-containing protein [Nitratireductor indicus]EKF40540.1 cyclic nucleotide-binding protein [Nitratireductor indicus C115]MDS1136769.1 cyclic nucleotide-binding domain-containing protein [Nitratireductor indicus]SFQ49392.1 Cyclic nucleotide-binding domain-containing protein [Nitratireductor indicus]